MAKYTVLKPFRAGGQKLNTGQVVDESVFTNAKTLMDQRYIAAVDDPGSLDPMAAGPTPDPKIAQDAAREEAAGRTVEAGTSVGDETAPGGGGSEASSKTATGAPLRGKLPEDFPGHAKLVDAGLDTYAKVRKQLDTIQEVDGIGPKTADQIRAIFAGEASDESAEAPADINDPLPDDFPGHAALAAAGVTTFGDVRARRDALESIENVGPVTAEAIAAAMSEAGFED